MQLLSMVSVLSVGNLVNYFVCPFHRRAGDKTTFDSIHESGQERNVESHFLLGGQVPGPSHGQRALYASLAACHFGGLSLQCASGKGTGGAVHRHNHHR